MQSIIYQELPEPKWLVPGDHSSRVTCSVGSASCFVNSFCRTVNGPAHYFWMTHLPWPYFVVSDFVTSKGRVITVFFKFLLDQSPFCVCGFQRGSLACTRSCLRAVILKVMSGAYYVFCKYTKIKSWDRKKFTRWLAVVNWKYANNAKHRLLQFRTLTTILICQKFDRMLELHLHEISNLNHTITSNHHQTLIEVYEGSRNSQKHSFLIAIKFKAMSPPRIGDYFS